MDVPEAFPSKMYCVCNKDIFILYIAQLFYLLFYSLKSDIFVKLQQLAKIKLI